jgi:hypothetical protein
MAHLIGYRGIEPRVDPSAFVAPTAVLIGNVEVGPESSIWFGAVLRGDHPEHGIRIGARSSIQDNCVLHVSARGPTVVGDEVTVGHGAVFESCEIRRGALLGRAQRLVYFDNLGERALQRLDGFPVHTQSGRPVRVGRAERFVKWIPACGGMTGDGRGMPVIHCACELW